MDAGDERSETMRYYYTDYFIGTASVQIDFQKEVSTKAGSSATRYKSNKTDVLRDQFNKILIDTEEFYTIVTYN